MQAISIDHLIEAQERSTYFDRANPGLRQELSRVNAELRARNRVDNFYASLATALNKYGSLTERQTVALKRSLTQHHDRAAQFVAAPITSPIPDGRVEITGVVKSTKWQENDFGGSLKMLVQSDNGWRVWGTVPASLTDVRNGEGLIAGDRVSFTATVTPKEPTFGFFSRPSKAELIVTQAPVAPVVVAPVAAPAPAAPIAHQPDQQRPTLAAIIARLNAQS